MLAAKGSAGFSSVEEMQKSKCEVILGFHLGKKKKGQLVKQILLKVSSNISQITVERVKVFPVSCCKNTSSEQIFCLFEINQPASFILYIKTHLMFCWDVIQFSVVSRETFPAANNSFLTLLLAQLPPAPWQSTRNQGQASQTASYWILLSGGQFTQSVGRDCVNLE